jgi:hypothetical protein
LHLSSEKKPVSKRAFLKMQRAPLQRGNERRGGGDAAARARARQQQQQRAAGGRAGQ